MLSTTRIADNSRTIAQIRDKIKDKIKTKIYYTDLKRGVDYQDTFDKDFEKYGRKVNGFYTLDDKKYEYEVISHDKVTTTFPRISNLYIANANSGKSYQIAKLVREYIQFFPNNAIYYASNNPLSNDSNYADIKDKMREIDIINLETCLDFTEFKDCLFIWDDCDTTPSANLEDLDEQLNKENVKTLSVTDKHKARQMLKTKTSDAIEHINNSIKSVNANGRKNNISQCVVQHVFFGGQFQTKIISESTGLCIFPYGASPNVIKKFIKEKLSFDNDEANELSSLTWYQYDFLFINKVGKKVVVTNDKIKIY